MKAFFHKIANPFIMALGSGCSQPSLTVAQHIVVMILWIFLSSAKAEILWDGDSKQSSNPKNCNFTKKHGCDDENAYSIRNNMTWKLSLEKIKFWSNNSSLFFHSFMVMLNLFGRTARKHNSSLSSHINHHLFWSQGYSNPKDAHAP